jgi:hypothetical protein
MIANASDDLRMVAFRINLAVKDQATEITGLRIMRYSCWNVKERPYG